MGTSARKQREVSDRERRLLDVARRMLVEQGFAGLSMDRLAEATEYSKGTVYQHFSTKEDLVAALAVQSSERRLELMARGAGFDGTPRERLMGIGLADELFAKLHPHYFHSELVVRLANLDERASAARREALTGLEGQCMATVGGVIDAAIARGDLALKPPRSAAGVVFSLAALVIGTHLVPRNFGDIVEVLEIADPVAALHDHIHAYLDGLGWRPLSTESDYADARRRLIREVFADECRIARIA